MRSVMYESEKDVEQVIRMLQYAKQDVDDIIPISQSIYHASEIEYFDAKEKFKILDFDEKFIEKLEAGESLCFKGSGNEKLVFCTEDETYEVKEGETSNSLILCPLFLFNDDLNSKTSEKRILRKQMAHGIFENYLEFRPTFPRLGKLRKILSASSYSGPQDEDDKNVEGYYLTELLETIQCSREELITGLKNISACCIDGRWQLLSLKYETEVLSLIVSLMEDQNLRAIYKNDAKAVLESQVPNFIIDHMFQNFATSVKDGSDAFTLMEDKVSRCFAEALLTAANGTFLLEDFVKTWKASLPQGMKPNLLHLQGLALIENGKYGKDVISLFQEYNLPEDVHLRFRLLFQRKEKWTLNEITPYIEKLVTKSMNINMMLMKFARATTVNGVKVYSAKYAS